MKKIYCVTLLFFVGNFFVSHAQSNDNKIIVTKNSLIDSFYKDLQVIQLQQNYSEVVPAYQIQVLSTKNRLEALKVKKDLEIIITDMPNEIVFKEPYYKLKVGLFKNTTEAEIFRHKIDQFLEYKKAVIVVPQMMNIKDYINKFIKNIAKN